MIAIKKKEDNKLFTNDELIFLFVVCSIILNGYIVII